MTTSRIILTCTLLLALSTGCSPPPPAPSPQVIVLIEQHEDPDRRLIVPQSIHEQIPIIASQPGAEIQLWPLSESGLGAAPLRLCVPANFSGGFTAGKAAWVEQATAALDGDESAITAIATSCPPLSPLPVDATVIAADPTSEALATRFRSDEFATAPQMTVTILLDRSLSSSVIDAEVLAQALVRFMLVAGPASRLTIADIGSGTDDVLIRHTVEISSAAPWPDRVAQALRDIAVVESLDVSQIDGSRSAIVSAIWATTRYECTTETSCSLLLWTDLRLVEDDRWNFETGRLPTPEAFVQWTIDAGLHADLTAWRIGTCGFDATARANLNAPTARAIGAIEALFRAYFSDAAHILFATQCDERFFADALTSSNPAVEP